MSKRQTITRKRRLDVFNRDKFICQKCGFKGRSDDLEAHHKKMKIDGGKDDDSNLITLCTICHYYSPDEEKEFVVYLEEKVDGNILDTFRRSKKSIGKRSKKGMNIKARDGFLVSRAPLGYKIIEKKLVPKEDSYIIQEIFQDFLNKEISLTKLAKQFNLSVNGLKKVLTNQTYLGKIKFDGQTHQGTHQTLISSTLFNHVQNKLEKLKIKK